MIKAVFILVLMLSSTSLFAQSVVMYEQKAVNYFFDTIFKEKYGNEKVVEFNGFTMEVLTEFHLYNSCFEENDRIYLKLRERSFQKTFEKKAISVTELKDISFKKIKIKSRKRLKLQVDLANEVDEKFYVLIEIIKQRDYTDAYMFELGKNGEILRWCRTGFIW